MTQAESTGGAVCSEGRHSAAGGQGRESVGAHSPGSFLSDQRESGSLAHLNARPRCRGVETELER